MSRARHFRIVARLDMASRPIPGKVTIDQAGTFRVRPLRRRRTYDLSLAFVADLVVKHVVRAELARARLKRRAA